MIMLFLTNFYPLMNRQVNCKSEMSYATKAITIKI